MEIKSCPVLHPTVEEFNDFYGYIHFLDKTYKKDHGMVKVQTWRSRSFPRLSGNLRPKITPSALRISPTDILSNKMCKAGEVTTKVKTLCKEK
jgi:hypothetical protein